MTLIDAVYLLIFFHGMIMRRDFIHKIKSYLSFLKESDFIFLEKSTETSETGRKQESNSGDLRQIADEIACCAKCRLSQGRTQTVPGDGNPEANLVFVGEAPGYYEDRQGVPFVGAAGKLLDKLLSRIGMDRSQVFICNVIKCRPPDNRDPFPDEIEACEPYLLRQLEVLKPHVICALGRHAAQTLLKTDKGINALRGKFHLYHDIPLLPTLHPAAVLRSPGQLRDVEHDFDLISGKLKELGG
ncbi:uracil-DNA glycosylase [Candidatus Sumerlaeota bacterium]|nr:uracil-DNA glycosylase [Candidatus Sumerlaeota bacterium]